jgi:Fic family protein
MNDWEHFVNEDGCHYPPLIQAALALYQFETIHPFMVGNGRVGRILVNLLLAERGRLSHPVLTLSTAIEKDRSGYHARLQTVRERGEVEPWLTYFLDNVIRAAETATATALSLGA